MELGYDEKAPPSPREAAKKMRALLAGTPAVARIRLEITCLDASDQPEGQHGEPNTAVS